jgi:serine/threonine protein kinase
MFVIVRYGMYFLHSSGIVHRDLKSLNLLLDSKWNLKVVPSSLPYRCSAVVHNNDPARRCFPGTIHWAAP